MDRFLRDKSILFIGIGFYDYEKAIVAEMVKQGAQVDYFKAGVDNLELRIAKYIPFIKERMIRKINHDIARKAVGKYDYVFVIKGDYCLPFLFDELKEKTNAIFIMYQWDSISRVPNFEINRKYFDYIYSFDREDVGNVDGLIFRPLFYKDEYAAESDASDFFEYDVCSLSVYYDYRYTLFRRVSDRLSNKKLFLKLKIGIPFYFKKLLLEKEKLDKKLIMFRNKSTMENVELMKKSYIIFDVCNPIQKGLTMRTIEALGMKKKLITTNKDVSNYDFYCDNNICIIDPDNMLISDDFFTKPYKALDNDTYDNYSISKWLSDIFSFVGK